MSLGGKLSTAENLKPPSAKKIIGQISHAVKFFRRHVKIIPNIINAAQVPIKNFGERLKYSINKTPAAIASSSMFKNAFDIFGFIVANKILALAAFDGGFSIFQIDLNGVQTD